MEITKGYDFDDLLLVPKPSFVNSREEVNLSTWIKGLEVGIPIIGSPMKGIMSKELALELHRNGSIGILHRFYDNINDQLCDINYLYDQYAKFGISVKLNEFDILRYGLDHGVNIVCVDVANGYLESVLNYVSFIRDIITKLNYSTLIMAGNVVTLKGANNLWNAGADLVRVGIGSGGLCTTRNITGVGYPQLSALFEVSGYEGIVSDGGIRNSGDIVKALAAGADFVMIGSLLGKAKESANNGIIYGMASRKLQEEYYQAVKSVEGIEKSLEKTTTVKELIDELSYGIRSACTYLNCSEVSKLHQSVSWVETGRGTLKEL